MKNSKDYDLLLSERKKIVLRLLTIIIFSYFSFISVIAFNPNFFGQLIANTFYSIGIVFGFLLILLIFIVTLFYVYLANKTLEPVIKNIHKQFK